MASIRTELKTDINAIQTIHKLAFERDAESDLVVALRSTNYFSPELSFVASEGDELVGHILFTRIVIKDGTRTYPVLALAPCSVKPEFQNQGIGTLLINEGLRAAKYSGHKAVIVLGDPKFYSRFGFEQASNYEIVPPAGMPEEAFLICKLGADAMNISGTVYYPVQFNEV